MSIQTTPPLTTAELAKLCGDETEVTQFNEELNITITTSKISDGYQQVFTKEEDGKTITLVRIYHDVVEAEEEVEEEVEEIEVDEEQLSLMKSSVTTTTSTTETTESSSSTTSKKKKSKKSKSATSEPEGDTSVVEEPFPGGHKEITTIKHPDGTYKTSTKIFYDDQHLIESKKEETSSTTTEETTTTKGKKKKSKKNQVATNTNIEVIDTREDDNGNPVTVIRERFENGYKDVTTTKYQDGTYKSTTQINYYPVEKEIIETTEIIEKEPASIRLVERSYVTDQNKVVQEDEEYNQETSETHEKIEKVEKVKKTKKKSTVEQNSTETNENAVVEKKLVKKTKKTTDEQKAAILQRDDSEGVVTVTTEKIEGGYREIRKTTFSDGSSKTEVKEHYDPVEEQVTFDSSALKKLPKVTKKPKEVVNADGSKSTIIVEKIEGGVRETTTTVHLDGRIKTSTREFYEPKEERIVLDEEAIKNIPKPTDKPKETINVDGSKTTVTVEKIDGGIREITTTVHTNGRVKQSMREFYDAVEETVPDDSEQEPEDKKQMGSILQKREQYQSATKTVKEEKVHTNATFQSRIRSN